VKTILIIIFLHSITAATVIEFDDARACKGAADAVHKLVDARTVCVPKAEGPKLQDRLKGATE